MKIGSSIPAWRVPTFTKGTLTFSSLIHSTSQPLVLCCTPSLTASQAWLLETHVTEFHNRHTSLATLVSRYMHYDLPWTLPSSNFSLPLLTDPLGRLSRSLGLSHNLASERCETLFFTEDHRLAFRLVHNLNIKGLLKVLEITEHHISHHLQPPSQELKNPIPFIQPNVENLETHAAVHIST
ncbi:MAG: hypothetical protein NPIRA05_00630 [Nitrospirales bacterium]|nr:MAG: hypothetical protein NPIRA05_00630 [Nitrospirales bacterium]